MAKVTLTPRPEGNFSYLPGSGIYTRGAVANRGYSFAHATFQSPVPLAKAFSAIKKHLEGLGRPMQALAGLELRIDKPLTFDGFGQLSGDYIKLLEKYDLRQGDKATTTRTNVALEPSSLAPKVPSVFAFTYSIPGARAHKRASFIGSGIGELDGGTRKDIIMVGKTTPKALRAKAEWVMGAINVQLSKLGVTWADVSNTNVYTAHSVDSYMSDVLLGTMGPAARYGFHWMVSRPPIAEIEFELDVRGVSQELML
jgi:hypothetical protein